MDLQPGAQAPRTAGPYICFEEVAWLGQGTRILPDKRRIPPSLLEEAQHPLPSAQALREEKDQGCCVGMCFCLPFRVARLLWIENTPDTSRLGRKFDFDSFLFNY